MHSVTWDMSESLHSS